MRRRYGAYAALLAIFVLLFSGCDALISNVFKEANLGQPSAEKLKGADAATLLEDSGISAGSVSDAVIETIITDEETMAAVLATLQETVNDPTAPPSEAQAAQALILNIELAASGADEILDNVNTSIGEVMEQLETAEGEDVDYAALIDVLLPDTDNLADIIDSLGTLTSDYDALAASIAENGNTLDQSLVADIALSALLSVVVSNSEPVGTYSTVGEAAAALVADIQANSGDPSYSPTIEDYFQSGPNMDDLTAEGTTLDTLFTAAGMGDLLAGLSEDGSEEGLE